MHCSIRSSSKHVTVNQQTFDEGKWELYESEGAPFSSCAIHCHG